MLTSLVTTYRLRRQADLSSAIRQVAAMVEEQQIEEERSDVREQLDVARRSIGVASDCILHARLIAKDGGTARVPSLWLRRA